MQSPITKITISMQESGAFRLEPETEDKGPANIMDIRNWLIVALQGVDHELASSMKIIRPGMMH